MPSLLYEKKGHVAYITFNRPEVRNAMDAETLVRLARAWQDFNGDDDLRVAILTGAGEKAFSSGFDLGRLMPLLGGGRPPEDEWDHALLQDRANVMRTAFLRGYELYKPIIAAINGYCLAGGTEIIQATDIRIAAEHATFGLTEVKRGIIPGAGSLVRLARQVPFCKAMEILLVGEAITAEEACRLGLINQVVPPDRLLPTAEEVAGKIASNGPLAVRKAKETVLKTSGLPLERAYELESESVRIVGLSQDAKEGSRAFMEKRKPNFVGR